MNVRGIRSSTKRKALLLWLNKQKADIIFLQETYSTKEVEAIWKTQYKGKMFYSHGTNHSRGVMILIKDDLEFDLKSFFFLDPDGRYILINAAVQGSDYLFVNIYAPNTVQEQCEFFSCLDKLIEKFHVNAVIQDICLNFDLVDI